MAFDGPGIAKVLKYVKSRYGTEPEFLWARFPDNAILRHRGNQKWYAALLIVSKRKLGIGGNEPVDILDVKCDPVLIDQLVDRKRIFPGYHMNKAHWITVLLDGSVADKDIYALVDQSYEMTKAGTGRNR